MFDYLYYKLYQASIKSSIKDVPHLLAPIYMGGIIAVNIIVLSGFLAKIDIGYFLFSNSRIAAGLSVTIIVLVYLYYNKGKQSRILEKYSKETEARRKSGNAKVWIYVILSFLSIFAVALYKPGKI